MVALAAALAVSLFAVSAAGGSSAQTPKCSGAVVMPGGPEPACITRYIVACPGGSLVTFLDSLPRAVLPGVYEVRPAVTWDEPRVGRTVDVVSDQPGEKAFGRARRD